MCSCLCAKLWSNNACINVGRGAANEILYLTYFSPLSGLLLWKFWLEWNSENTEVKKFGKQLSSKHWKRKLARWFRLYRPTVIRTRCCDDPSLVAKLNIDEKSLYLKCRCWSENSTILVELPQRRGRARTLSNEKLLDSETPRYQRLLSDNAAGTFTGRFRKGMKRHGSIWILLSPVKVTS